MLSVMRPKLAGQDEALRQKIQEMPEPTLAELQDRW
jgi:hypothetical protein